MFNCLQMLVLFDGVCIFLAALCDVVGWSVRSRLEWFSWQEHMLLFTRMCCWQ